MTDKERKAYITRLRAEREILKSQRSRLIRFIESMLEETPAWIRAMKEE